MDYTVQFTDMFAQLELSEFHDRLHEIFESLLNAVTKDIPAHDQVRFVLRSPQLEYPISLPFLPLSRLTTERVLAEIERVIQSNREFRLNDSVQLNLIHVEMPNGGTGTKRSEINLEKHLAKKGSVIRIQNKDDMCLARALVVSIAKIENNSRYKTIIDHRWSMQTRLAHDLHEKANVSIGPCGLVKSSNFKRICPTIKSILFRKTIKIISFIQGLKKRKGFICLCMITIMTSSQACRPFFARKRYCHTCKKAYDLVTEHLCPDSCQLCGFQNCPIVSWLPSIDCNRVFKSQECFDRHKQNIGQGKSLCALLVKCCHCNCVVKWGRLKPDLHHCGQTKCST